MKETTKLKIDRWINRQMEETTDEWTGRWMDELSYFTDSEIETSRARLTKQMVGHRLALTPIHKPV